MQVTEQQIWSFISEVNDPEIPVLNVVEMGIVREVEQRGDGVCVVITPTYSGCPAMKMIEDQIVERLAGENLGPVRVETVYAPAWTTDWMTEEAREKMRVYGISPPGKTCGDPSRDPNAHAGCPFCGSDRTELRSTFGSTACKALHYCHACEQPFEHFKCI